jgi:hypothetical protein
MCLRELLKTTTNPTFHKALNSAGPGELTRAAVADAVDVDADPTAAAAEDIDAAAAAVEDAEDAAEHDDGEREQLGDADAEEEAPSKKHRVDE